MSSSSESPRSGAAAMILFPRLDVRVMGAESAAAACACGTTCVVMTSSIDRYAMDERSRCWPSPSARLARDGREPDSTRDDDVLGR